MAQFIALDRRVEVNGRTVLTVVDGMRGFSDMAFRILASNGIVDPKPGEWYSQQAWLDAFREISVGIGAGTLLSIGRRIPENAEFPPEIDNITAALSAIDVAYHMNHRIGEQVLFDPATGELHEGIGNYLFESVGRREALMRCPNPYPCDFDRGIIEAMARRFAPNDGRPHVEHINGQCRKTGDEACHYRVTW